MNKSYIRNTCFLQKDYFTKVFRVMKITLFILLFTISTAFAKSSYSQNARFSIHLNNATVIQIFGEIQKKSEFIFLYRDDQVDLEHKSNVDFDDATVGLILDQVFKGSNMSYKIFDRQIVISTNKRNDESTAANSKSVTPQKREINGKVMDNKGVPLPGVSVVVKETTLGTVSDAEGQFRLMVPIENKSVVFSFIGMVTQEITIGNQNIFNIILQEQTVGLEEVVAVGYGLQKKESVVGAISQVTGSDIMKAGVPSISNSLGGRIPGIVTIKQNGAPGSNDAAIYIRGVSSFGANNAPLVLVDGIERSMSNIDPSEVEKISVLKDASATAVFGVKGANGVVLITTKRGQEGKMSVSISYDQIFKKIENKGIQENSYNTLSARNQLFRYQNQYTKVLGNDIMEHYRIGDQPYIYPNVDSWSHMVKNFGIDTRATVSARGGTNTAKFFIMVGYLHEGDILKRDQTLYDPSYKYDRANFRMNFDFDISKTTKFTISSGGYSGTQSQGGTNSGNLGRVLSGMISTPPYLTPYTYSADFVAQYPDIVNPGVGVRAAGIRGNTNNPLTTDYIHNRTGVGRRTTISLGADADLNQDLKMITEGLKFKASISYNSNSYWSGTTIYNGDYYVFTPGIGGSYQWNRFINGTQDNYSVIQAPYQNPIQAFSASDTPSKKDYNYAFQFDYSRSFGRHNVSGLGLMKRRVSQIGDKFAHYEENWVGRTTYDYDGRYLFEVNVGISGSEQFAPANRFGVFPACAIGWNLGREKFMKSLPMISNLKIRYSYGQTGSDNTGLDYLYLSDYANFPPAGYINSTYPFVIGAPGSGTSVINALAEGAVPNRIAQWERAAKNNLGFDFGFYGNKLSLTFELFDEHRTGILMPRNAISDMFGQTTKALNFGTTKKHGYELEIGYKNNTGKLDYYAKANFNFNENRVIEQDDLYSTPDYRKNEGKPINFGRSLLNIGYYQDMDEMKNYSLGDLARTAIGSDKVLDFDGNGVINEKDIIPIGYTDRPNKTYGLTAGITYKNFEFNFLLQGALEVNRNYAAYNRPLWSFDGSDDMYIKMQGADDIWSPENRTAKYAVWGGWNPASKGILNGQYIRLKSIELAYSLSNNVLKSVGLKSARFSLLGSNLLTYASGYMLGDPENEPNVFPYDKSLQFYPNPRLLTFSLNITF